MFQTTASQVRTGCNIQIPGFGDEFHGVEAARPIVEDGFERMDITVWPANLAKPPFDQPSTEREWNFGHFYANLMVGLSLTPEYPVFLEVDNTCADCNQPLCCGWAHGGDHDHTVEAQDCTRRTRDAAEISNLITGSGPWH